MRRGGTVFRVRSSTLRLQSGAMGRETGKVLDPKWSAVAEIQQEAHHPFGPLHCPRRPWEFLVSQCSAFAMMFSLMTERLLAEHRQWESPVVVVA